MKVMARIGRASFTSDEWAWLEAIEVEAGKGAARL